MLFRQAQHSPVLLVPYALLRVRKTSPHVQTVVLCPVSVLVCQSLDLYSLCILRFATDTKAPNDSCESFSPFSRVSRFSRLITKMFSACYKPRWPAMTSSSASSQ